MSRKQTRDQFNSQGPKKSVSLRIGLHAGKPAEAGSLHSTEGSTTNAPLPEIESDPETIPHFASETQFGQLLSSLDDFTPDWSPKDLEAILSHQLSAPMAFDFCSHIKTWVAAEETRSWPGENTSSPKSFHDLFTHVSPSRRLLRLTKEFAKANCDCPESALPKEVALVLYYTCIAVALSRHNEWITDLKASDLRQGFSWVISRPWIDEETKAFCTEGIERLKEASPA